MRHPRHEKKPERQALCLRLGLLAALVNGRLRFAATNDVVRQLQIETASLAIRFVHRW